MSERSGSAPVVTSSPESANSLEFEKLFLKSAGVLFTLCITIFLLMPTRAQPQGYNWGSPPSPGGGDIPITPTPGSGNTNPDPGPIPWIKIRTQPTSVSAVHGSSVSLSVGVIGTDTRIYQWCKDGVALSDTTNIVGTTESVLHFKTVRLEDQGAYWVDVTGIVSRHVTLKVRADAPSVKILSPAKNRALGSPEIVLSALISDQLGVSNVLASVNDGPWITAVQITNPITPGVTLPGRAPTTSQWAAPLTLNQLGPNRVIVRVLDFDGIATSVTNMVTYNQFLPVNGTYNGLFSTPTRLHESSGSCKLTLSGFGSYTGSLNVGGQTASISGTFDQSGTATNTLQRSGTNWLNITLNLNLSPDSDLLTGTVVNSAWTANLCADRAVFGATNACPFTGRYTLVIPGAEPNNPDAPTGYGFGTVTVDKTGALVLNGSLADGTQLSQSTHISKQGFWPLHIPLYSGKGSVYAWLSFTNAPLPDLTGGQLSWSKPQLSAKSKYYQDGFLIDAQSAGSRYNPQTNVFDQSAEITFAGPGLTAPFTNQLAITSDHHFSNTSANALKITLNKNTGIFTGSVKPPGETVAKKFTGAILQNQSAGFGYFLDSTTSGSVELRP